MSEVDARPSDAIALAVLTGSPIFVAEDVLERAGADMPPAARVAPEHKGAKSIIGEIEEMQRQAQKYYKRHLLSEEDCTKARDELMAAVFGS